MANNPLREAADRIKARGEMRQQLLMGPQTQDTADRLALIDAADANDGRILAASDAIIDGTRPERVISRALRNLITEWGITKESVTNVIMSSAKIDTQSVAEAWINRHSSTLLHALQNSVLAEIRKTIGPMVKTEVQTFLDRHLKITIVPPTP